VIVCVCVRVSVFVCVVLMCQQRDKEKERGQGCKIRKVFNRYREGTHVEEIGASSSAAACLPWEEFSFEARMCDGSWCVAGAD